MASVDRSHADTANKMMNVRWASQNHVVPKSILVQGCVLRNM